MTLSSFFPTAVIGVEVQHEGFLIDAHYIDRKEEPSLL